MLLRRHGPRAVRRLLKSVAAQTITTEQPKEDDLRRAFSDLLISEEMFDMLGPAINSGRGHVPLRLSRQRQDEHRRADHPLLRHDGLDPQGHRRRGPDHQALRPGQPRADRARAAAGLLDDDDYDRRWIEIRRPTIIAGGELRMEDLEIHYDPVTKISEAPLQMKSNNWAPS